MSFKKIVLISLLFISAQTQAQTPLQQKLSAAFNRLQTDSQCRYASLSLTVLDAKTGEQVFAVNPDMGLAPGSTLKTITSITAFNLLGKDFHYQTQVGYSGTITNGTLNGDIIIKGGGDPTLGSWRWDITKENHILAAFVKVMRDAGIKKINGSIIGDDSVFGTQSIPDGWIMQDIGTYYGAGTSGLCWRENSFDIKLHTGNSVGTPVTITHTVPAMPYLSFKSELITGPAHTGDQSYPYLPALNSNVMYIRGTYAIDQTKKSSSAAVPDPAYDAAYRLTDTLRRLGIDINGQPESTTTLIAKGKPIPQFTTHLISITSPGLSSIIYQQNHVSINLYAEQLLKTIALKSGKEATTANGVKVMQDFWAAKGIDSNTLNIFDGSGLSPGNRVTTLTVARILQSAKKESWFPDFYDSLPIYNDMHMKSGSINSALAYAGYQTYNGRELCFSIIVNNYYGSTHSIREKMFRVLDVLK